MIYIHVIILLLFLLLFLRSSNVKAEEENMSKDGKGRKKVQKFFYKSARYIKNQLSRRHWFRENETVWIDMITLNPALSSKEEKDFYYVNKICLVLIILFMGNLLGLCIAVTTKTDNNLMDGQYILRKTYGDGSKNVELDAYIQGQRVSEKIPLEVSERQYQEEETEEIFTRIEEKLELEILGDNQSLDYVNKDLNLITSISDFPVNISWELDNYLVMNSAGKIQEDYQDRNGTLLQLTAILTYYGRKEEHIFCANVYPLEKTEKETRYSQILNEITIAEKESLSSDRLKLPSKIDNQEIKFREKTTYTGLYLVGLSILASLFIYRGKDKELHDKVEKRQKEMMICYPEIVCKLTLLLSAGMTIKSALEEMGKNNKKMYAYEEIRLTLREIDRGIPETEAYARFGKRSKVQRYMKLGALLSQNLKKGNSSLLMILEEEAAEAFEERKASARRLGEEAGTKLLLPMGIMLIVVMIIVIIPAFLSFHI